LAFGNYFVRVKDILGCESVYDDNPVVIENIAGPEVTLVSLVPENDYLQNGQIDIIASTTQGQVYYSIDGGFSFQTNDGLFANLSSGTYTCLVKDDNGCDTTFTVDLERTISQLIEAIAGNGTTCIGDAAVVPIKLNNFKDIFKFHVKLTYDTTILSCDGYMNVYPEFENKIQVSIVPLTDEVIVSWQGENPTTLEENTILLELVFSGKKQGLSGIDWAALAGESAFYNENLEEVNVDYHVGALRVYTRPKIIIGQEREVCENQRIVFLPYIEGGSGQVSYFWQGPGGFEQEEELVDFTNTTSQQAGIYQLTVTDTIGCVESKSLNLTVNPVPKTSLAEQDTLYGEPGFILEAGSDFESYLWNTGETTHSIRINDEGLYTVEVTSQAQCKATDSVTILFSGEAIWLPNAFTPDGDGLNDEFKPVERYDMVKTYHFSIYNRWGQLIFETSDISQGWDGTFQGNPAEQGTYVYKIVFTAYPDYNQSQTKTGSVVLVR
jgi:gliding motility-associated-like protein